ncbi:MAG: 16S rRNA (cytosine(967)-C(5))-methyltransferase RsmB, partial [Erysipelotrichaceae bacterium]|nr:16S rRNA (cytosine(967)-C(5))-methyltransferase RsmB [Erysipelotrichaceae bacterium]
MYWIRKMNVRQIAHRCLCDTMLHQQYASLNMRAISGVSEADRALITQIVYQTLRNYRYVRYQWSLYVKRMPPKEIRVLLDMSTAQLLLLDRIPVYAVVNEAAEISRKTAGGSYVSLVNAVLHKVADNGPQKVEGVNEDEILAIETSHPDWLLGL